MSPQGKYEILESDFPSVPGGLTSLSSVQGCQGLSYIPICLPSQRTENRSCSLHLLAMGQPCGTSDVHHEHAAFSSGKRAPISWPRHRAPHFNGCFVRNDGPRSSCHLRAHLRALSFPPVISFLRKVIMRSLGSRAARVCSLLFPALLLIKGLV